MSAQRERAFQTTMRTLSRLCDCFERGSKGDNFVDGQRGERSSVKQMLDSRDPSRVRALLAVFDYADLNSEGTIGKDEIDSLAQVLGYKLSVAEIDAFFEQACGARLEMAFSDFTAAVVLSSPSDNQPQLARHAGRLFGFFAAHDTGSISITNMNMQLARLGLDTVGTEQLFMDITGLPKRTVSRNEFTEYLERADREGDLASRL